MVFFFFFFNFRECKLALPSMWRLIQNFIWRWFEKFKSLDVFKLRSREAYKGCLLDCHPGFHKSVRFDDRKKSYSYSWEGSILKNIHKIYVPNSIYPIQQQWEDYDWIPIIKENELNRFVSFSLFGLCHCGLCLFFFEIILVTLEPCFHFLLEGEFSSNKESGKSYRVSLHKINFGRWF